MDSNYEAQKQITKQRIAARHEQARAERLLREGYPAPRRGIGQFLLQLFRRPGHRREKKAAEASQSAELAVAGKGKG